MPRRGNITVSYCVCFTVSINIECRRAWLQNAGSYQRGVNIFCVFCLSCGGDKEMGGSPAVAERLSQVTGLSVSCRQPRQISCKLNTVFPQYSYFSERAPAVLSSSISRSAHVASEEICAECR